MIFRVLRKEVISRSKITVVSGKKKNLVLNIVALNIISSLLLIYSNLCSASKGRETPLDINHMCERI